MILRSIGFLLLSVPLVHCAPERVKRPEEVRAPSTPSPAPADRPTIVFLGTSLTAGFGLEDPEEAYPALIQRKVDSAGLEYRVVNAGVSGESSAGALRRIDWILGSLPAVLVVETGANDGLRGQDLDSLRAHLQGIIDRTRALAPRTLLVLVGMEALPNLGATYTREFRAIYTDLARKNALPLIPFPLAGVAGVDSLNQADGMHPTARGQMIIADHVWQVLGPLLKRKEPRKVSGGPTKTRSRVPVPSSYEPEVTG